MGSGWKKYRKIPKRSPSAYVFQRPFLKGLFLEGLIFRGADVQWKICVSKSIGLALYSRTPLFWTRLIRSPRYFKGRSNSLGFTLMFSVIYYQLFRTRLIRSPRYFELIVLSLHLKSTPLFRTCQKQSTYIRAQLETYCILFELEQNIQRFFNATASADLSDI